VKRPWLTTQKGQKTSMLLGWLLSALVLVPLGFQFQLESSRSQFPALNTSDVEYCEIDSCGIIEPFGLEIRSVEIVDFEFNAEIRFEFVNHNRLTGTREVWLRVRKPDGTLLEMAKGPIYMDDKSASLVFTFTGTNAELESSSIYLGF